MICRSLCTSLLLLFVLNATPLSAGTDSESVTFRQTCKTVVRDLGSSAYRIVDVFSGKLDREGIPKSLSEGGKFGIIKTMFGFGMVGFFIFGADVYRDHLRSVEHIYNWFTFHGSNFNLGMAWMILLNSVGHVILPEFYMKHPRFARGVLMAGALVRNFHLENHATGIDWPDVVSGSLAVGVFPFIDRIHNSLVPPFIRWTDRLDERAKQKAERIQSQKSEDVAKPLKIP